MFLISPNKYVIYDLMQQDEEAEGKGNKENGKEGKNGEEGYKHLKGSSLALWEEG